MQRKGYVTRSVIDCLSDSDGTAGERVQATGTRQYGVGTCNSEAFACEALHVLGESGAAADERFQCAKCCQFGMGICDRGAVG